MRNKVYFFVFDGLVDWEAALTLCVLREQPNLLAITVGMTKEPQLTMGGLKIIPDITLDQLHVEEALIFILPGGEMWNNYDNPEFFSLLNILHKEGVVIAAICGGTLAAVRAGLHHGKAHTSNSLEFIKELIPTYKEEQFYKNEPAIADSNLITASGTGYVEFAYQIMRTLSIYDEPARQSWVHLFKGH